ncbi:UDP-N-acetylmuramoyl-tripeptide--D-alanyl-D-alanine ligase [Enterococcus sp. DIV1298c]|uniref:Mur ligase family protein n=1 Tax=Enterococcus sp. DIV1298c TaxID=2815328 RepID=UPI001A925C71|nr:UDP-N-acetylmuramoyl-tripeptide--D-alanyl-D-alanine ligase [Enterococcus sp. DIV1298c]MBO0460783.1 UDP-N-acetylmuramoyl-tripeptide--D-alanyl-D-alanine ligase [Enterococcus sp. DIV1298c]
MNTIKQLLSEIEGSYFEEYTELDQEVNQLEYFSGHLKRMKDYSKTMFVCITNERRQYINQMRPVKWADGNDQIKGKENQFALIVTEHPIEDPSVTTPQFIVKDSWRFLLEFANKMRQNFKKPVIAITGSAGKTSTRMMITHAFKEEKVLENRGNHNVRFAIPLYLGQLVGDFDLLNLEVSLNALNTYDTGSMSDLIQPDIAIVTSIGEAHLSSLKTTKNVAYYKSKIFDGLKENGTAIINTDMGAEELAILVQAAEKKTTDILTYSLYDTSRVVHVSSIEQKKEYCEVGVHFFDQKIKIRLSVPSSGMISNALATLIAIWKIKGDVSAYLSAFETFRPLPKVLEKSFYSNEPTFTFIDDTHNASLPSMKNAIEYFKVVRPFYEGKSILVLGQIADLGNTSASIHQQVMEELTDVPADHVFGYGEHFRELFNEQSKHKQNYQWFETLPELTQSIQQQLTNDSLVLAKGSVTGSDFHEIDKYIRRFSFKEMA